MPLPQARPELRDDGRPLAGKIFRFPRVGRDVEELDLAPLVACLILRGDEPPLPLGKSAAPGRGRLDELPEVVAILAPLVKAFLAEARP